MLIIITYPICDIRVFLGDQTGRLKKPVWPLVEPDKDFVRSIGQIKYRKGGGVQGWVGENFICVANKAIRFTNLRPFTCTWPNIYANPKIKFRRFYFDGTSVGKFEVGIEVDIQSNRSMTQSIIDDIVSQILNFEVAVPNPLGSIKSCQLYNVGSKLANLYLASSTEAKVLARKDYSKSWIQSLKPLIIIVDQNKNVLEGLSTIKSKYGEDDNRIEIAYKLLAHKGFNYPSWIMFDNYEKNVRLLRVYLSRLHTEKECFRHILRCIATGSLVMNPRSKESDALQDYLNLSTRKILSLNKKSREITEEKIEEYARELIDLSSPGEKENILGSLSKLDIRKNIYNKIDIFYDQIVRQCSTSSDFPMIKNISDNVLKEKIVRALDNLTIENVDLGLFDLAKILESQIKSYLLLAKQKGLFEVTNKDLHSLNNMIDCVVDNEIFPEKYELHFLRQERNKRAHDEVPDFSEREKLLRHSNFLADLYISYITAFNNLQNEIV